MQVTFKNALAKAKREMKKVDFDKEQLVDVCAIVSIEYLLTEEEAKELENRVEVYVDKNNSIYSMSFDDFCKYIECK